MAIKKKQVSLDVFQTHVFPSLQAKFATEPDALQKTINDEYEIYEEDESGKKTPIMWRVNVVKGAAKEAAPTEEEIQEMVDKRVNAELEKAKEQLQAAPGKKIVKGPSAGDNAAIKIPAEIRRVNIKSFTGKQHGLDADERCYAFGMWTMACVVGDDKAKQWCNDHGIAVTKVHSEGVNTAGGYTVPEILSTDLISLKETYGVARRLFQSYTLTSDTLMINRRTGGLTGTFTSEGSAGTEGTMALDQVRLVAKDLMILTRLSNQLSADAILNWSDLLAYEIGYGFALKEDQCGFIGDATSTYGGMTGITVQLKNKWSTGQTPGTLSGLVKQGSSTTWATIVMGDFDAVVGALPQYADTPNACWVMHRSFYYTVVEKLIQASGGVPAYEVRAGQRAPRPIFKGYPVEFSQVYPSTTASASVVATLGDHSLAAAFGDRQMDAIAFSTEASIGSQSVFERNQIAVRGIERFDINVHDVGDGTTVGPVVGLITG